MALVLRHYDGLLLPDVAAALGVSYPEAERILQSARTHLEGTIGHFDDGTGADPYGRLVRGVPGPPDSLADRVWVTVDAALVPDYAADGTSEWGDDHAAWRVPDAFRGRRPAGLGGLRRRARPGGARARGQGGAPGGHDPRRRRRRARSSLLAVAALTAPRSQDDQAGAAGSEADRGRGDPVTTVAPDHRRAGGAASTAPRSRSVAAARRPTADLQIIPTGVPPHTADEVQLLNDPTVSRPDPVRQADVSVRRRYRDGTQLARRPAGRPRRHVDRVAGHGAGRGAQRLAGQPEVLQAWSVDGGGVIVSLRIAGASRRPGRGRPPGGRRRDVDPPARWRASCSRRVRTAPSCASRPGEQGQELTTYQVMSTAG